MSEATDNVPYEEPDVCSVKERLSAVDLRERSYQQWSEGGSEKVDGQGHDGLNVAHM